MSARAHRALDHILSRRRNRERSLHRALDFVLDAAFRESEHPRVKNGPHGGEFTAGSGGGGGRTAALKPAPENRKNWPAHIQKLRVPPAWTDVKINPDPDGDLLVVGKDVKGRQQYMYSEKFRNTQTQAKFARVKALAMKFGAISKENESNLHAHDPLTRENAACAQLIMKTGIRPGSETNTKAAKQAFGATTLQGRHVIEKRGEVYLRFVGKKGVDIELKVADPALARELLQRSRKAGRSGQLFPDVTAKSLLGYIGSLDGGGFKSKDLRTAHANKIASETMSGIEAPSSEKEYKKRVLEVAKAVAGKLGNTPVIALQSYISPELFGEWKSGIGSSKPAAPPKENRKEYRKPWAKGAKDEGPSDGLPDVYFGDTPAEEIDWRDFADDAPDDDEELLKTPSDVVELLGFDPKEFSEET